MSEVFLATLYGVATLALVLVAGWMVIQAYFNVKGWFFDKEV